MRFFFHLHIKCLKPVFYDMSSWQWKSMVILKAHYGIEPI